MRRLLPALIASLLTHAACAASLPAPARAEIEQLLARLQSTSCEFNRNGAWYSAAEARGHLLRKLDYLDDKNMVRNAEQFITLAATKSSMSGQPYQVRCAGAAPVQSGPWLSGQLAAMRAAAPHKP